MDKLFTLPTETLDTSEERLGFVFGEFPHSVEPCPTKWLETRKSKHCSGKVIYRTAKEYPKKCRMSIRRDDDTSTPPAESPIPARDDAFSKIIGKARCPCSVDETLHECWHARPPDRTDGDEMFTPFHIFLEFYEIRLEFLYDFIPMPEYWVKPHISYMSEAYFMSSSTSTSHICLRECSRK